MYRDFPNGAQPKHTVLIKNVGHYVAPEQRKMRFGILRGMESPEIWLQTGVEKPTFFGAYDTRSRVIASGGGHDRKNERRRMLGIVIDRVRSRD